MTTYASSRPTFAGNDDTVYFEVIGPLSVIVKGVHGTGTTKVQIRKDDNTPEDVPGAEVTADGNINVNWGAKDRNYARVIRVGSSSGSLYIHMSGDLTAPKT